MKLLNLLTTKHQTLFRCRRSFFATKATEQSSTITYLHSLNPYSVTLYNHLLKKAAEHDELNNKFLEISIKQANQDESKASDELQHIRKQLSQLNVYVKLYEKYQSILDELQSCSAIIKDPDEEKEIKTMAEDDLAAGKENLFELQEEIIEELIPKRSVDSKNVQIEIRQAAGGSEASLFAEDLVHMYKAYSINKGWRWIQEEFQSDFSIGKGCKMGVFKVIGEDVYKHFRHESGVHKVQRVPETEKAGRMHSSTATVVVMPEVPKDFSIDEKDIRIDTFRASGAGGQHVNKTDSACRATHIPTGIMATCQDARTQFSNKATAIENLKKRLYAIQSEQENEAERKFKKDQIGSGNLGDKIRSYNWPSNRITDHRLGVSKYGIDEMLAGDLLDEFVDELIDQEREQKIIDIFGAEAIKGRE